MASRHNSWIKLYIFWGRCDLNVKASVFSNFFILYFFLFFFFHNSNNIKITIYCFRRSVKGAQESAEERKRAQGSAREREGAQGSECKVASRDRKGASRYIGISIVFVRKQMKYLLLFSLKIFTCRSTVSVINYPFRKAKKPGQNPLKLRSSKGRRALKVSVFSLLKTGTFFANWKSAFCVGAHEEVVRNHWNRCQKLGIFSEKWLFFIFANITKF